MKRIRQILLLAVVVLFVQNNFAQTAEIPRNEVNFNILNTILFASVEVGYEYFVGYDQSVGGKVLINDRPGLRNEKNGANFSTNAIQLNYSYYFGKFNPGSEFYIQPFVKYRFGDFKEEKEIAGAEHEVKTDMNAFILGIGAGYMWNFSNSFIVGPYVNFGRNFSKSVKERFSEFEVYAGLNIGYRF